MNAFARVALMLAKVADAEEAAALSREAALKLGVDATQLWIEAQRLQASLRRPATVAGTATTSPAPPVFERDLVAVLLASRDARRELLPLLDLADVNHPGLREILETVRRVPDAEAETLMSELASDGARHALSALIVDERIATDPALRDQGLILAKAVLAHYGLIADPDWQSRPAFARLEPAEQDRLKAALAETLILMTRAEAQNGEYSAEAVAVAPPADHGVRVRDLPPAGARGHAHGRGAVVLPQLLRRMELRPGPRRRQRGHVALQLHDPARLAGPGRRPHGGVAARAGHPAVSTRRRSGRSSSPAPRRRAERSKIGNCRTMKR